MEPFSLVLVALAAIVVVLILKFKGSSSGLSKADGKLGDKLPARKSLQVDDSKPAVRILYGTQTGTAERFSKQLGNELRRKYGDSTSIEVSPAHKSLF
jgi:NADPH-ferrihemoprotein reductase